MPAQAAERRQKGGSVRTRFFVLAAALLMPAAPAAAQDATGEWLVADATARIRIVNCGSALWGVVSWEKTPGGRDVKNPDAAKRERPTLGMPVLLDMRPADGGRWKGKVYNAKDGKIYDSTLALRGPSTLRVEGCVLGFLCGGENWTRAGATNAVQGAPAPSPQAICASVGAATTGRAH